MAVIALGADNLKIVNMAIACVDVIYTDDGRELRIKGWFPKTPMNDAITIDCTALVYAKDSDGEMTAVVPGYGSKHDLKKMNLAPEKLFTKDGSGREFDLRLTADAKTDKDGEFDPKYVLWMAPMTEGKGLRVEMSLYVYYKPEDQE